MNQLRTRSNPTYRLTSHDIPKGKIKFKSRREITWEETEVRGQAKVAVVCINRSCLNINIIDKHEVMSDGFVDRGNRNYGISCIKCKCGTCYWPYLVGWRRAARKLAKRKTVR